MSRNIMLMVFLFSGLCLNGQVTMTLQVPPSGVMLKPQLWNMTLLNSTPETQVKIGLVLSDVTTGQAVLTGMTNSFLLMNGAKQIQANDIVIDYDYPSPLISDHDPNGYLAIGNFEACYTLYNVSNVHISEMLDECINVNVEPLSPPILSTPFDQSTSENAFPLFTWLPPSPLNLFSYLTYEFKLVEVQPGQASSDAIQNNIPIMNSDALTDLFINYPSSNMPLDTSKTYAWQIIAKNNSQYAAESDIWTFKLSANQNIVVEGNIPYIKLKKEEDGSLSAFYGVPKFYYYNESEDSIVSYKIWNVDNVNAEPFKSGSLHVLIGRNFIELPIENELLDKTTYLFELLNSRNESWNSKFIYNE